MSLVSNIYQQRAIIGMERPAGDFSAPWTQQQFFGQRQAYHYAPKWKQLIDHQARTKFLAGVSSTELSVKLSDQYHKLLAQVITDSGLYDHLKNLGVTPLVVGGLARGNSSVRSDFDLVLWGEDAQLSALENTFRNGQLHQGFSLLSELDLHGMKVSRPLRSVGDLVGHLRSGGIDAITALLSPRPLIEKDSDFPIIEKDIAQFIGKNQKDILRQIGDSVREREKTYGAIFKLAQFNLKESRGGLRDIDTLDWVRTVRRICNNDKDIVAPENSQALMGVANILNKAKHAWHFTQDTPATSTDNFTGQPPQGGQRRSIDKVNYVGYGARRQEFCRLLSDSLGGLLQERDVDEMIYYAAILNARFVDEVVETFCSSGDNSRAAHSKVHKIVSPRAVISKQSFADQVHGSEDIASYVRQLFQSGELGNLFAEFRYAEPFVDRAGFHLYSLGEHHVQTLERVEHLVKNGRQIYPELYDLVIVDAVPLYVAALCHDLAKPDEGLRNDHNIKGAMVARKIAQEIGLADYQIERSAALVEDHMIIADLANGFSRCADRLRQYSPKQLERLCDPAYLRELFVLTLADKYASNPLLWTPNKEQWLFSSYLELQYFFKSEKTYNEKVLGKVRTYITDRSDDKYAQKIETFVSEVDKRILSHYSPTVLARQLAVLERARDQHQHGSTPFVLEFIEVSGVPPLYHVVLSCLDSAGLFGRINKSLVSAGMRLTSAYVHTTEDGFACDYLTAEPKNQKRVFLDGDLERFIGAIRNAALDEAREVLKPRLAPSGADVKLSDARFSSPVEIAIKPENENARLLVTISGKLPDDMIGRVAPLLEFEKLNIKAAKLRTGNREQRYILYPDTKDYDIKRLPQLEPEVREALGL